jgi:nucleotide-binding universal stress UspA family protein
VESFARVAVAIDGTAPSERAERFSVETLSARGGVRLSFVTVADRTAAYIPGAHGFPAGLSELLVGIEDDALALCARAGAAASAHGVAHDVAVVEGSPAAALCRYVDEHGCDAIVVGTHARRGLGRGGLGSVASAVVRASEVPVFVVRTDATLRAGGPIVVALDDSPPAHAALGAAMGLAVKLHLALRLVHVDGDRTYGIAELEELALPSRALGLTVDVELRDGHPAAALIEASRLHGAALIATGTHGRPPLQRFVLGSVAEALIRDAPVPVMTVRA